jgi:hypothetical protein
MDWEQSERTEKKLRYPVSVDYLKNVAFTFSPIV